MSSWSIADTRTLVERLHGRAQLELVAPSLRSVIDRGQYAKFHYREARKLLEQFVATRLQTGSLLEVFLGAEDEETDAFQDFIIKIGAHVTACSQSMHAVADILAHALYFSFGLNLQPSPLSGRDIGYKSVLKKLLVETDADAVCELYSRLGGDLSFVQLSALVNHGKHRSIVLPSLNEDLTGLAPHRHTVKISSFTYDSIHYQSVAIGDFLAPEFDRCSKLIIDIGNALNAALRRRVALKYAGSS